MLASPTLSAALGFYICGDVMFYGSQQNPDESIGALDSRTPSTHLLSFCQGESLLSRTTSVWGQKGGLVPKSSREKTRRLSLSLEWKGWVRGVWVF